MPYQVNRIDPRKTALIVVDSVSTAHVMTTDEFIARTVDARSAAAD